MSLEFEWDDDKAAANLEKHNLSFDEASSVFVDPLAKIFADDAHSAEESREIIIGHSVANRLILVSFVETNRDRVRIISARKATKRERKAYEERKDF
jgi:uncharacterized DUF497 family protein